MSESNSLPSNGGIGILGVLGVLFVGLKLGGVISWSWWWVTLPFWGGLALVLSVGTFLFLILGFIALWRASKQK